MSKKKAIITTASISILIGAILGSILTFYFGIRGMEDTLSFASELIHAERSIFHSKRAHHAYQNEDPIIGIWALEGIIEEHNKILNDDFDYQTIFNERTVYIDLMLFHARLAKLYEKTANTEKEKFNQEKAVYYAVLAYPAGGLSNIDDIMDRVDIIDSNTINQKEE